MRIHMRWETGFIIALTTVASSSAAERLVRLPVDELIKQNRARISATPSDIGRPIDVLQGSDERVCRFTEQPSHLTLIFDQPVRVSGARVRFSHSSAPFLWRIESADNEQDLNDRTNSFATVSPDRSVPPNQDDETHWPSRQARIWRLVCKEETGDRFNHLQRFDLLCTERDFLSFHTGFDGLAGLRLHDENRKPISPRFELPGNQCRTLGVEGFDTNGNTVDLTGIAHLAPSRAGIIDIVDSHILVPRRRGSTAIQAQFAGTKSPQLTVAAQPAVDLAILCIEREPRYPRYHPHWEQFTIDEGFAQSTATFVTGLDRNETLETRRWPNPGDQVTFTAVVFNRGNLPATRAKLRWSIDTKSTLIDLPKIEPGETARLSQMATWRPERFEVAVEITDPQDTDTANNSLSRASDALEFTFLIEEGYRVRFNARTPQVKKPAADSIDAWIHHHFHRFNQMFQEKQCQERIAVGHMAFVSDGAPNPPDNFIQMFDGRFPERFRANDKDWRLGGSGYYRADEDIDYGFLHEMGHQLGLIDLYRLNLEKSQNLVNGEPYRIGDFLMSSCGRQLSEHTARALDAWHGHRRGYYGQYLYDLPATITIRLTDADSRPISNCDIAIYQKIKTPDRPEELHGTPKFLGKTDNDGRYELPNTPIDTRCAVATAVSQPLKPNPWGHVAAVGYNGLFLIEAQTPAGKQYAWLPITEANLAFWRGDKDHATITLTAEPTATTQ